MAALQQLTQPWLPAVSLPRVYSLHHAEAVQVPRQTQLVKTFRHVNPHLHQQRRMSKQTSPKLAGGPQKGSGRRLHGPGSRGAVLRRQRVAYNTRSHIHCFLATLNTHSILITREFKTVCLPVLPAGLVDRCQYGERPSSFLTVYRGVISCTTVSHLV